MGGGGRGGRVIGEWKDSVLEGRWSPGLCLVSLSSAVRESGEGSVLRARGLWGAVAPSPSPAVPASPSSSFSASWLLENPLSLPSPTGVFSLPISVLLASSLPCLRPVPRGTELLPLPIEGCSSFRFFLGFGLAPNEEKPIVCARESGELGAEVVEADIMSMDSVERGFEAFGKRYGASLLTRRD